MQGFPEIDGAVLGTPSHGASGTSTQLGAAHTHRPDGSVSVQGFPEIDGAVLGTPSHGASGTSTQLNAAHTQARQSCSQHSSGRLSDVCVWGCVVCGGVCGEGGGRGENGSHAVHAALGGWAMCMKSRGSRAINTHCTKTVTPYTVRLFLICPFVHQSLSLSISYTCTHTDTHIFAITNTHSIHTSTHTHKE